MKRRRRNSAGVENSDFESDGDSRGTEYTKVQNGRRKRGIFIISLINLIVQNSTFNCRWS